MIVLVVVLSSGVCLLTCSHSDKVVFAPCYANAVGIFDVATKSFETVSTGTLTMDSRFWGAATLGSKVVFAL